MQQNALENYLNQLLDIPRFHDYCPNGLQVEGRTHIHNLISGVTASLDFLNNAVAMDADAVLVHHGYFWRGEDPALRGMKYRRIALLIKHEINLFAYHLPLDAHIELGNNAQLGKKLNFMTKGYFGEQNLAVYGQPIHELTLQQLEAQISSTLVRKPVIIGDPAKSIRRVAWCTGAAQSYFEEAIRLGVDAFITGEISEQNVHAARESGVAFISAGHHATERYGVQALGEHIAQQFNIDHQFVDSDNPV
ncbi:MAG TPA: Nif3-like dinuclear metal center hexameric protein [Nitrosomonas nitrosa]|jgi:dinuclear metal center YbgI/SA1388 family protein|uniref:GTP cyclohydrolase 1 type 2 homolog n=1 Tax=Nitrosomonas nitrosa TaxID=52442 RepID=A0A8H9DAE1_9PROT|nr:Nif3-like dinuclear metal center hexameric protein [Nitrosomonas nitrosa]MCO6433982.1 Nif3-like dinuclear metal center hexameric protein [Nitrosomonas nitrosa]PTR00727.1 dinuclear metal center YbgI/SA1388 family protein [Nitrosomonas nitrosa]CAE6516057.1 GTP cyclohydrolase 1 type 2 homolog [Nitrosomonas nitrosa]HBZ29552.1 Nif3-like dinuclear metal center hexameric protein [Nitrosomonas nitrosa]HNP50236.1 Nif3-like dinuclear metal center hexameric protein [Nitrosomonas nitrosa]